MASTDLITYLNYMSTWDTESDENIDDLINEQTLFVQVDDFDSDSVIDDEFKTLVDLAMDVRDHTIAADSIQMAADAAAVASIWSFGMGMAAFAALEASEMVEQSIISSKSDELNDKLSTVDTDIADKIGSTVSNYVAAYKENNNLINSKAPAGLDTTTCRSNLMQFMGQIQKNGDTLDADTFRKYAGSARLLYDSDEIDAVYDALDELNLSDRTDADIDQFMDVLNGVDLPDDQIKMVQTASIFILSYKMKIATDKIKQSATDAGIPVEEVDATAFEVMDAIGKFSAAVVVVMSVVDIIFNIFDIEDVVKQCDKMCDQLKGDIKDNYTSYFNGIKEASQQYIAAISETAK